MKSKILLLNSYHKGFSWTDEITRGVEENIDRSKFDIHIEYMDTKRQFDTTYQQLVTNILMHKHAVHNYDIVIVSDNNALEFMRTHMPIFGEDKPVFFCGVNYYKPQDSNGIKYITGVSEEADVLGNIQLIKKMHPKCDSIIIITEYTPTGNIFRRQIENYKKDSIAIAENIEVWYDYTAKELVKKLSDLSENKIVLYTLFLRDRNNRFFEYDVSAEMVTEASPVPVYGTWDFSLRHGIVGGRLISGYEQGKRAAQKAMEYLNGKPIHEIPVEYSVPSVPMFDYEVLQEFNMDISQLPVNSLIINQPESFFYKNKKLLLNISFLFGFMLVLIVLLAWANRRLHRVNLKLNENEQQLKIANKDLVIALEEARRSKELERANEQLKQNEKVLKKAHHEIQLKQQQLEILNRELLERNEEMHQLNEELLTANDALNEQKQTLEDTISQLKNTQMQLVTAEKMASFGVLTAGIAHEINNPLNYIQGGKTTLENYVETNLYQHQKDIGSFLEMIQAGIDRAVKIVRGLNHFNRNNDNSMTKCDIRTILDNCLMMLDHQIHARILIDKRYVDKENVILGNEGRLHQLFLNVLLNAVQAIKEEGTIKITTINVEGYFQIQIADSGCGISEEILPKITDPFFTTKAPGEGTGLGLSIAYTIVKEHKGQIHFSSEPREGTTVTISFPLTN